MLHKGDEEAAKRRRRRKFEVNNVAVATTGKREWGQDTRRSYWKGEIDISPRTNINGRSVCVLQVINKHLSDAPWQWRAASVIRYHKDMRSTETRRFEVVVHSRYRGVVVVEAL